MEIYDKGAWPKGESSFRRNGARLFAVGAARGWIFGWIFGRVGEARRGQVMAGVSI